MAIYRTITGLFTTLFLSSSLAIAANVTLDVIPSQGDDSSTDNIYTTIQEAINAANINDNTYIRIYDKGSPYLLHDGTELGDEPAHINFHNN